MPAPRRIAGRAFHRGRVLTYTRLLPHIVDTRFTLDGQEYRYVWHEHAHTWRGERAVEVPIALAELATADPARTLEVGNVLSNFVRTSHQVLDKYERAPGVLNEDAATFRSGPFDLIVSVSTLEHVGYDEEPREPDKAARAVRNLVGLLAPGGTMLATIPMGHNRDLDDALMGGALGGSVSYLRRVKWLKWEQVEPDQAKAMYGWPWPGANVVAIAAWKTSRSSADES
jgi:SAM-dependent methyltransferase